MKSLLYLATCVAVSLAAPASWSYEMAAFYSEVNANILDARSNHLSPPTCDLSNVDIISYIQTNIPNAPSPIPSPGDAKLLEVTIGRGIQNYTCADSTNSSKPVAIGAVANLYNISCIAANYPKLQTLIAPFVLQENTTLNSSGTLTFLNWERVGNHYFNAEKIPTFDLNDNPSVQLGILTANATDPALKANAPASAVKGQASTVYDDTGAVTWLKLMALNSSDPSGPSFVYRIDTAGGAAPATCEGQPSLISVQYAAQYWFFKS